MAALRGAVVCWMISGIVIGTFVASLTVVGNNSIHTVRDATVLLAWIVAFYGIGFACVGLCAQCLLDALSRKPHPPRSPRPPIHFVACAAFCVVCVFVSWLIYRPSIWPEATSARLLAALLVFATSLSASVAVLRTLRQRKIPAGVRNASYLLVLLLTVVPVGVQFRAVSVRSRIPSQAAVITREPTGRKVMLIGVDGADWRFLHPLMSAGKLPNFRRLCETGVTAPLRTLLPTWSPIIWTTIVTGVDERRHGVRDFTEMRIPGLSHGVQRFFKDPVLVPPYSGLRHISKFAVETGCVEIVPITSYHRRVKALWNILSDHNVTVGVVNWFATFPAEAVNGVMVSDRCTVVFRNGAFEPDGGEAGKVYPSTFDLELDAPLPSPDAELSNAEYYFALDDEYKGDSVPTVDDVTALTRGIQADHFSVSMATKILREYHPEFTAVYISGIDVFSHFFLKRFPDLVPRYYRFVDLQLESLLAEADDDTTVILVSDHGWGWKVGEPFGHAHAPDGVLIMSGSGVGTPGRLSTQPDVRDIAPTILALMGFPFAQDLDGRVMWEALSQDVRHESYGRVVDTYGFYEAPNVTRSSEREGVSADNERAIERLKALGYVGD